MSSEHVAKFGDDRLSDLRDKGGQKKKKNLNISIKTMGGHQHSCRATIINI